MRLVTLLGEWLRQRKTREYLLHFYPCIPQFSLFSMCIAEVGGTPQALWSQQAREDVLTRGRHIQGPRRQAMHSYQAHHLIVGHVTMGPVPPVVKAVISMCHFN